MDEDNKKEINFAAVRVAQNTLKQMLQDFEFPVHLNRSEILAVYVTMIAAETSIESFEKHFKKIPELQHVDVDKLKNDLNSIRGKMAVALGMI